MTDRLKKLLGFSFSTIQADILKVLLLSAAFFFISWAFTSINELKDAFFITFVGKESLKWAKFWSIFILIPGIALYSYLVDRFATSSLIAIYCTIYGFACLGGAYCLLEKFPSSAKAVFGWLFYFLMEGFHPFVIGLFWAFLTSISTPEESKKNYVFIIGAIQLGGIASALFSWKIIKNNNYSALVAHQIILFFSAIALFSVPFFITLLFKHIPHRYLIGYAALDKEQKTLRKNKGILKSIGTWLKLLTNNPYLLGIFGMLFFWEVISIVFSYQRLIAGANLHKDLSSLTGLFFEQVFFLNSIGLAIVLLGSGPLINKLGHKICLMLTPLSMGGLLAYYLLYPSTTSLSAVYVLLRAINFAFAAPLRESLYIPTSSETRFKLKSFIDVFGSRFAKGVGSYYNIFTAALIESSLFAAHSIFFTIIIVFWTLSAYFLGRKFEKAITNNQTIE